MFMIGPSTPMNHRKVQEFGQAKMATAVMDYTAQEPGELTLRTGDAVEGRWYMCQFGLFIFSQVYI